MLAETLQQRIETIPILRTLLEAIYRKHFSGNAWGAFHGVYETFKDANQAAPRTKPLGFDNAAYAQEFENRLSRALSFDYPVMFWLGRLIETGTRGVRLRRPSWDKFTIPIRDISNIRWAFDGLFVIYRRSSRQARSWRVGRLAARFPSRLRSPKRRAWTFFLAAGSLQYIEAPPFGASLAALCVRPRHLLLNKLPLYEGKQIVTLQNGGPAFHPQYVFNRKDFIDSVCAAGYELIDQWDVPSHPGRIPFHPEASFRSHTGLYFRFRT